MAIDAIIVHDMKINEYSVHFSVYFQRVTPSEKVEIVSTLYFNTAKSKVSLGGLVETEPPEMIQELVLLLNAVRIPRLLAGEDLKENEYGHSPQRHSS